MPNKFVYFAFYFVLSKRVSHFFVPSLTPLPHPPPRIGMRSIRELAIGHAERTWIAARWTLAQSARSQGAFPWVEPSGPQPGPEYRGACSVGTRYATALT